MFNFIKKLFSKKTKTKIESKKEININEWSYQRFCEFYNERVFKDERFKEKIDKITECVNDKKYERLDLISEEAGCPVEEVIMKIRYSKNKRVIDGVYIDRVNKLVKKCTSDDEEILNKYYEMLYSNHYLVQEMAEKMPNYHNKPLPIIKEDIYKDIKYLYEKNIINGIKLDESRREIIYYTLEKKRKAERYATINCPRCGTLVDVVKKNTGRCEYCGSIVEDTTNGKY